MSKTLRIWCNQSFEPSDLANFQKLVSPHDLIISPSAQKTVLAAGARDATSLDCDILLGQPHVDDVLESRRAKLVQLSSAGYTRFDRADFRNHCKAHDIAFCNASSLYNEPCAQHTLAMMLALARALPQIIQEKTNQSWNHFPFRAQSFLLTGQTVLLVGYGAIARRLAELLQPFHMQTIALRRTPKGDEKVPTYPIARLMDVLPQADHVINILPASAETFEIFHTEAFARMKPGAIYYNIGRGDTTNQQALQSALTTGHLRYAYLDVTTPEPLPPGHPLWTIPTCHITPHTAGGTIDEPQRMIHHFVTNVRKFETGQPLVDRLV